MVNVNVMALPVDEPSLMGYGALMRTEVEVLSQNVPALEKKLTLLQKRANDLGVSPIDINCSEDYVKWDGDQGHKFKKLTIDIQDIMLGDWRLIATLQRLPDGNVIRNFSDIEIPANFRTSKSFCDHCKINRARNETYIVGNSKEFRQVGSSCLEDFLGFNATKYISFASLARKIITSAESYEGLPKLRSEGALWPLDVYLACALLCIKESGWVSRSEAFSNPTLKSTADCAWLRMTEADTNDLRSNYPDAIVTAREAIDWIDAIEEPINEYLHNLKVIVSYGAVEYRTRGYAASIINAYSKSQIKETSTWQGVVGERKQFSLKVANIFVRSTSFGTQFTHIMHDASGNEFIWITNTELNVSETYTLSATIKAHQEVHGKKQTVLTRCRIK